MFSLFLVKVLGWLLEGVECRVGFVDGIEIILEVNFGIFEQVKFVDYWCFGINCLFIGVQSFQVDKLQVLGCIYDGVEVVCVVDMVCQVGFDNFNFDLMYGLFGQSFDDVLVDLCQVFVLVFMYFFWY